MLYTQLNNNQWLSLTDSSGPYIKGPGGIFILAPCQGNTITVASSVAPGYVQDPDDGYWYNLSDASGPYVRSGALTFVLAGGVSSVNGASSAGGAPSFLPVAEKIRTKVAAAYVNNPLSNAPLIAPPNWATATAYVPGQAVTNSGNVYICIIGGTSGTAPTTTVAGPIADNTVSWFWAGPSFSSASNAPTSLAVTSTAYTGVYYRTTTGAYSVGSSQISDSTNFTVGGASITETGQNNGFAMAVATVPAPNGQQMNVSFMCDAKQLQIHIAYQTSQGVTIYCDQNDGKGMCPLTLGISGVNVAAQNYYQIVWPTAKPRRYIVEVSAAAAANGLLGVLLNEGVSKVWATVDANNYRVHAVGDSYFAGATYYPVSASLQTQVQVCKQLGCVDFVTDGESGSGYVTVGAGSIIGSAQRVAFAKAMAPDVLWISGGSNDAGNASATITAAVLACLQAYRAALPGAIILLTGCNANQSGPSASVFACEAAILAAFTQFNDPNSFYYPFSSTVASKAFLSGTGTTAAPTGAGNCDLYLDSDSHPSYQGAAYLAYRHTNAIRQIVNTWKF